MSNHPISSVEVHHIVKSNADCNHYTANVYKSKAIIQNIEFSVSFSFGSYLSLWLLISDPVHRLSLSYDHRGYASIICDSIRSFKVLTPLARL